MPFISTDSFAIFLSFLILSSFVKLLLSADDALLTVNCINSVGSSSKEKDFWTKRKKKIDINDKLTKYFFKIIDEIGF